MKNKNLNNAKKAKNDEFYTQLVDIEKELKHYIQHFKGKVIYLNCDDPEESNFWNYFKLNFEFLGLKKLISTHFDKDNPTYKLEMIGKDNIIKTNLKDNGDFRSAEAIEVLKECDIVVTNPPFSLFREYIAQLMKYDKKFLIIGNINAITYKEIFSIIKNDKMWLGYTSPKKFIQQNGSIKKFGNINWFTNLEIKKRTEQLILYKRYYGNEKEYPKYDNYDAINVDRVKDIPIDYDGIMGVPITFLGKYNPEQFEIIWQANGNTRVSASDIILGKLNYKKHLGDKGGCPILDGKIKYIRFLIKNKKL